MSSLLPRCQRELEYSTLSRLEMWRASNRLKASLRYRGGDRRSIKMKEINRRLEKKGNGSMNEGEVKKRMRVK